jgi:hypothetical protein
MGLGEWAIRNPLEWLWRGGYLFRNRSQKGGGLMPEHAWPDGSSGGNGNGGNGAHAATVVVDQSGAGDATSVQAGLALLPAGGGSLYVREGNYIEQTLVVPANVTIEGTGRATNIVPALALSDIFSFTTAGMRKFSNFRVSSGALGNSLFVVNAPSLDVELFIDNIFADNETIKRVIQNQNFPSSANMTVHMTGCKFDVTEEFWRGLGDGILRDVEAIGSVNDTGAIIDSPNINAVDCIFGIGTPGLVTNIGILNAQNVKFIAPRSALVPGRNNTININGRASVMQGVICENEVDVNLNGLSSHWSGGYLGSADFTKQSRMFINQPFVVVVGPLLGVLTQANQYQITVNAQNCSLIGLKVRNLSAPLPHFDITAGGDYFTMTNCSASGSVGAPGDTRIAAQHCTFAANSQNNMQETGAADFNRYAANDPVPTITGASSIVVG